MSGLCRDCARPVEAANARCPNCASPRLIRHPELSQLAIAHIDCDAFYASVEKRDRPELRDRPVIVGGGQRGVVSAACYVARLKGVHSAMPMYRARKLCPDAEVIRPDMAKYQRVGGEIRELMRDVTPMVEPLSVDEAFLDLTGTERLHRACPAETLIRLINRIEAEVGVTASVGLSYNKFLAKTASDLHKPRGFAVIGREEAMDFLNPRPVDSIWGVGKSLAGRLKRDGLKTIGQLRDIDEKDLIARYGEIGQRLSRLSRGEDSRRVNPSGNAKSISSETTFGHDIGAFAELSRRLWPQCEQLARRLKSKNLAAAGITLKLRLANFQILTRSKKLPMPTQLAEFIYRAALPLLEKEANGRKFRLIGIGAHQFADPAEADRPDLIDGAAAEDIARIENAMSRIREKFGSGAILKGRGYQPPIKN